MATPGPSERSPKFDVSQSFRDNDNLDETLRREFRRLQEQKEAEGDSSHSEDDEEGDEPARREVCYMFRAIATVIPLISFIVLCINTIIAHHPHTHNTMSFYSNNSTQQSIAALKKSHAVKSGHKKAPRVIVVQVRKPLSVVNLQIYGLLSL